MLLAGDADRDGASPPPLPLWVMWLWWLGLVVLAIAVHLLLAVLWLIGLPLRLLRRLAGRRDGPSGQHELSRSR